MGFLDSLKEGISNLGQKVSSAGRKFESGARKASRAASSGAQKAARATVGRGGGRISIIEFFVGAVIYTVTALVCFGFGSPDIVIFRDFAPLALVVGALLVYGADKESVWDTSLIEIALLLGSIILPLTAAGNLPWIDQYLGLSSLIADVTSAFIVFMGSVLMLILSAKMD